MLNRSVVTAMLIAALATGCSVSDRQDIGGSGTSSASNGVGETSTTEATGETPGGPAEEKPKDLTSEVGMTSGVDSIGIRYTSAGALVTNPNEGLAAYNVTVVFNLLDAAGTVVDTDSTNIDYIPAGATVPVVPLQIGFDLDTEPADVTVEVVGEFGEDAGWDGVDFLMGDGIDLEVHDPRVQPGEFGDTLSFTVTNPSSDSVAEFGTWSCVFQASGGVTGGESSGIPDPIVPGGTVRVDAPLSAVPSVVETITCRATA